MNIIDANNKLFESMDELCVDYSDAARDRRNKDLSDICVKALNQGWCAQNLKSYDDTARLLFGMLFSYRPRCSNEGECPPSALAFTDGTELVVSSAYMEALRVFKWPMKNTRPLSSMDRELAGTLIHEAAHLFLNHPERMRTLMNTAGKPHQQVSDAFNLVADLLVEHYAGACVAGYSGSATKVDIEAAIVKRAPGVRSSTLSAYTRGEISTEAVVREVLKNMPPPSNDKAGGSGAPKPSPNAGLVVPPKAPTDEVQQQLQTAVNTAVATSGVGSHPLLDTIETKQPQFTIADALTVACTRASRKRSMQRIHPAFAAQRIALPSRKREVGSIVVAVDSSASVSRGELHNACQEISGVAINVGAAEIILFTFDGAVSEVTRYYAGDPISSIEITSRGGTSFDAAVARINELAFQEPVSASIIITDGEDRLRTEPKTDLVWAFTRVPGYGPYKSLPGQHVFLT